MSEQPALRPTGHPLSCTCGECRAWAISEIEEGGEPGELAPAGLGTLDRLAEEAIAIEAQEAREAGSLGFMARLLVQVTLPHSKVDSNEFERRNGPITIAIMARSRVGIPYGRYPRLLLAWITTEAVRTRSARLELGETLSSFMGELGLVPTGGRWGTVPRLRDQMRRLFAATVSWTYDAQGEWIDEGIRPIEKAHLWWDPKQPEQAALWRSEISLNRRFYEEIISRPVPLDMRALRALRSPLALDIYTWLTYRMSYLRKPSTVPWELLQLQFGGDYARTRKFKENFLDRLKQVKTIYPSANIEPTAQGLMLRPSHPHVLPDRLRG
jgi:hypothetical protein